MGSTHFFPGMDHMYHNRDLKKVAFNCRRAIGSFGYFFTVLLPFGILQFNPFFILGINTQQVPVYFVCCTKCLSMRFLLQNQ